ncbi:MAG TPA: hypothetical protein VFR15_05780 [Chloroflexia bacterium]|nr:hypothetical protein [Chloroflexia bacterium]
MNRTKLSHKAIIVVPAMLLALAVGTLITAAGPVSSPVLAVAAAQVGQAEPLAPVGSAFTYQGSLKNGGNPANGQFDFQFKLYDALSGGGQIGSTLTVGNQTVAGGLFTVQLDFGAAAFRGDARWLEIAVRPAGGGTYTTLSPRQPLSATPYASSLVPGSTLTNNSSSNLITVNNTGTGAGMYGESAGGVGMRGVGNNQHGGLFTNNSTIGYAALQGIANGTPGYGIYGEGNSIGVWGSTLNGTGVRGATTDGYGVHGYSIDGGTGVRGESVSFRGVHGRSAPAGTGVYGESPEGYGVSGTSTTNLGVLGVSGSSYGVYGTSTSGVGVFGQTGSSTGLSGVLGISPANSYGVRGQGGTGVAGFTVVNDGVGVRGESPGGYGIYGWSSNGWAGWFAGNVNVTGGCCEAAEGTFKIDHPLDPQNKYLVQSAVQSDDMMSVYNGNATTDAKGGAVVTLPDYVEALNKDFRYQLTIMGEQFAQARIARKIKDNRFTIKTDKPNIEVSWQVTGVRKDAYARAHPIQAEVEKSQAEKGKYRHPTEHGQPESKGIGYEERQQVTEAPPKPPEPKP